MNRRAFLSALAAVLLAGPALAGGIEVSSSRLDSFSLLPLVSRFGALEWRGGLELSSVDRRFGGFSSLAMSRDGKRLLAVSDRGYWLKAGLKYDDARLAAVVDAEMAPILDAQGRLIKGKVRNDAEALAAWEPGRIDGRVIVGFESRVRAGVFDLGRHGLAAPFVNLPIPAAIAEGPGNQELESILRFPDGRFKGLFLAIAEGNFDANGDIRAWMFGASSFDFSIARHEDFAITDTTLLPTGDLVTIERSYGPGELPRMAVRRIATAAIGPGKRVAPTLLMQASAPFGAVDNMEGIALSEIAGETRLTFISDDNYNRLQRTILLQFALVS